MADLDSFFYTCAGLVLFMVLVVYMNEGQLLEGLTDKMQFEHSSSPVSIALVGCNK